MLFPCPQRAPAHVRCCLPPCGDWARGETRWDRAGKGGRAEGWEREGVMESEWGMERERGMEKDDRESCV